MPSLSVAGKRLLEKLVPDIRIKGAWEEGSTIIKSQQARRKFENPER